MGEAGKSAYMLCEPFWQLSSVTESTRYQADVETEMARQFRNAALAWKALVEKILSVYIRHHEGSFCLNMPNLNLWKCFCSVWVRGAGPEDLSGLSTGGVLFLFFKPIELLGLWLEGVLVSGG